MGSCYRSYYEAVEWTEPTARERERFTAIVSHIPAGIGSALEIGCGDGRLSESLPVPRLVCADLSFSALLHFRRLSSDRVQASAALLPFPDHSFDLVVCSEVLEHLPDAVFEATRREICRLTARYALVTVPYDEDLREENRRCPACHRSFHLYGHLRTFKNLDGFLPDLSVAEVWKFGPEARWLRPLLPLRRLTGGGTCLHCGQTPPSSPLALSQRILDWIHYNCLAPWHKKPYWIGALYERSSLAAATSGQPSPHYDGKSK